MKRRPYSHPLSVTPIAPAGERRSAELARAWIAAVAILGLAALVLSL